MLLFALLVDVRLFESYEKVRWIFCGGQHTHYAELHSTQEVIMTNDTDTVPTDLLSKSSRQQTAKNAAKILVDKGIGFVIPTPKQKRILLIEFARRNLVVYGKAFDILKATEPINLDDQTTSAKHLDAVVLTRSNQQTSKKLALISKSTFLLLRQQKLCAEQSQG